MPSNLQPPTWGRRLAAIAAAAIVVVGLHLGREVILPAVSAALLGFILMPSVFKLERLGLRRGLAVGMVSLAALAAAVAVIWVLVFEIGIIASTLPTYAQNIRDKLDSLGIERALRVVDDLARLSPQGAPVPEPGPPPAPTSPSAAVPVRVVEPTLPSAIEVLSVVAREGLRPLIFAGLTGVLMFFLLLSWEDVRERCIRLVSFGRLTLTTRAMDEVARTISSVLRLQLAINTAFGLIAGLALWALGTPAAPLWGMLAILLRFVPYAGVAIAALMPMTLALAVSDGWALPLAIAGVFLALEVVTGNFVEPLVFSSRHGVSTLALLVSAVFWTWLWGAPGLLLSTPITVGLAVIGRHVPQLKFLDILLGATPVLAPPARFYQRLVTLDHDDAAKIAAAFRDERAVGGLFQQLFMPAVRQLKHDQREGLLEDDRVAGAVELLHDLIDEAGEYPIPVPASDAAPQSPDGSIVCIPAHDETDALAAAMLAVLIARSGRPARALSTSDLGGDLGSIIRQAAAPAVCISAVPPFAARYAKLRRRQVELRAPGVPVLTGLWAGELAAEVPVEAAAGGEGRGEQAAPPPASDQVITTFDQMLSRLPVADDQATPNAPGV